MKSIQIIFGKCEFIIVLIDFIVIWVILFEGVTHSTENQFQTYRNCDETRRIKLLIPMNRGYFSPMSGKGHSCAFAFVIYSLRLKCFKKVGLF